MRASELGKAEAALLRSEGVGGVWLEAARASTASGATDAMATEDGGGRRLAAARATEVRGSL